MEAFKLRVECWGSPPLPPHAEGGGLGRERGFDSQGGLRAGAGTPQVTHGSSLCQLSHSTAAVVIVKFLMLGHTSHSTACVLTVKFLMCHICRLLSQHHDMGVEFSSAPAPQGPAEAKEVMPKNPTPASAPRPGVEPKGHTA